MCAAGPETRSRFDLALATRVEVRVLVDNVTDMLSSVPSQVTRELDLLIGAGMTQFAGDHVCRAYYGFSILVTAFFRDRQRTILFDAGPEPSAIRWNGRRLGIDFGAIDGVVVSHGHWDHAGGLCAALSMAHRANGGRALPTYVHPEMFRTRGYQHSENEVIPFADIPQPDEIRAVGGTVVSARASARLLDGAFFLSGEIPRVTPYEKGLPGHVRRTEDGHQWEPEPWIVDERFVAVNVERQGLVIFTACSHAGVINILSYARSLFPSTRIHALVGGFHLAGESTEEIIPATVHDLKQFELAHIVPAHCTGWRAVHALVNEFGDSVVMPSAVGKRFVFDEAAGGPSTSG